MSLLLLFAGAGVQPWQRDDGYAQNWLDARRRHEHELAAIALAEKQRLQALHNEVQSGIERRAREAFDRLMDEQQRRRALRERSRK